jgi:hypothetical protein
MYISRLNVPCLCNLAGPALPRSKSDREQVVVERRGRRELGTTTGLGRDPTTYRVLDVKVDEGHGPLARIQAATTDFASRRGMGRIGCTCKRRGNVCMMITTTDLMARNRYSWTRVASGLVNTCSHSTVSVSNTTIRCQGCCGIIGVNSRICVWQSHGCWHILTTLI